MTHYREIVYTAIRKKPGIREWNLFDAYMALDPDVNGGRVRRALQWLEANGHVEADHSDCKCPSCRVRYNVTTGR